LLTHVDANGTPLCDTSCPLLHSMTGGEEREAEVYLHHKEGHRVPVNVRTFPVIDAAGEIQGAVEVFTDRSTLQATLEKLERLSLEAETDPLTGVGNRRSMEAKLGVHVGERRKKGAAVGVLFLDIDHFKDINDRFGHEAGDRTLRMVTETLRRNMRASDSLARWGGDEFVALLREIDPPSVQDLAEKLRSLVASSYLALPSGPELRATISIGGTLLRREDTEESVIARADHLLYESKSGGRNRLTWQA